MNNKVNLVLTWLFHAQYQLNRSYQNFKVKDTISRIDDISRYDHVEMFIKLT